MAGIATSEITIFAMGKLGAKELNLSSDVDLIITSNSLPDAETLKKVNLFTKLLTESAIKSAA